jgi:hypothetical protein
MKSMVLKFVQQPVAMVMGSTMMLMSMVVP